MPLCAVPVAWTGRLCQQLCSRDTVAVALLCPALAIHPGLAKARVSLVVWGQLTFMSGICQQSQKTFQPSWPSRVNPQVLELAQAPQAVLGHRDGWVPREVRSRGV